VTEPLRGTTFSPAERWFNGGTDFALKKLDEVDQYLRDLNDELWDERPWWCSRRRWYRRHQQRVYDIEDAARTVGDARRQLAEPLRRGQTGPFPLTIERLHLGLDELVELQEKDLEMLRRELFDKTGLDEERVKEWLAQMPVTLEAGLTFAAMILAMNMELPAEEGEPLPGEVEQSRSDAEVVQPTKGDNDG
jgi:hypothetical protein